MNPVLAGADQRAHTMQVQVTGDDIDELGHVNNVVYLSWCEHAARTHSERVGMGMAQLLALGHVAVVRQHTITYHQPALLGDQLEVRTELISSQGIRARRATRITRTRDDVLLADCLTDWVWVDAVSGRPKRPDPSIALAFGF